MKYLLTEETVNVPSDVKIKIANREVEVEGKLGKSKKCFKHVACDIAIL